MTRRHALAALLLAPLAAIAPRQAVAQSPMLFVGTWRATGPAGWFLLHIRDDGRIEALMPGDGRREVHTPLTVRAGGLAGVLPTGESWGIGRNFGQLLLSVGTQLFTLTPIGADEYAATARQAQQRAAAQAAQAGELGGLALSTARSSNGGYFDSRDYVFCSDGSFRLTKSVVGPGVAGENKYAGRWRTDGAAVEFVFNDGGRRTMSLRRVAADVFELDGVRYAAKRAGACR